MIRQEDPQDWRLAIVLLRLLKGWAHQADLAAAAGIHPDQVSDYEAGRYAPSLRTQKLIATAAGVPFSFLKGLVSLCRGIRLGFEAALGQKEAASTLAMPELDLGRTIGASLDATIAPFLLQLDHAGGEPRPRAEDHAWAAAVWSFLEPLPAEQQRKLAAFLQCERSWALAVRIAVASEDMAADRAEEALRLARLAIEIAEGVEPEAFQKRLLGWVEPFLGNAFRVGGKLPEAREAFAHADLLWEEGAAGDPTGLLDGSRRLDLEASMLRQDGKFDEAISKLDEALRTGRPDWTARLLVKKATTYSRAGEYEQAIVVARDAGARIDAQREPRQPFLQQFTLANCLCHLDHYEEAEPLVTKAEGLVAELGNKLDEVRTRWLRGRVCLGLGQQQRAVELLSEVREHFRQKEIAYDYALATTELATLHLEEGRTGLVKEIAAEMVWIFDSQQVHQEALAALTLFCQAAEKEEAGAAWTRELVKYLYRAQHRPGLRFGEVSQ